MEFNKEKALDDLMKIFNLGATPTFSEQMKAMASAQNYLEQLHLQAYELGLETGIKKIETNDRN